jgi:hypothetical protein
MHPPDLIRVVLSVVVDTDFALYGYLAFDSPVLVIIFRPFF